MTARPRTEQDSPRARQYGTARVSAPPPPPRHTASASPAAEGRQPGRRLQREEDSGNGNAHGFAFIMYGSPSDPTARARKREVRSEAAKRSAERRRATIQQRRSEAQGAAESSSKKRRRTVNEAHTPQPQASAAAQQERLPGISSIVGAAPGLTQSRSTSVPVSGLLDPSPEPPASNTTEPASSQQAPDESSGPMGDVYVQASGRFRQYGELPPRTSDTQAQDRTRPP